jgi:hypothetical protein
MNECTSYTTSHTPLHSTTLNHTTLHYTTLHHTTLHHTLGSSASASRTTVPVRLRLPWLLKRAAGVLLLLLSHLSRATVSSEGVWWVSGCVVCVVGVLCVVCEWCVVCAEGVHMNTDFRHQSSHTRIHTHSPYLLQSYCGNTAPQRTRCSRTTHTD